MSDSTWARRRVLVVVALAALVTAASPGQAQAAADDDIVGLWSTVVDGSAGTYKYVYSFAAGALVTVGDIDANWDGQGSSFGPTVGSYQRTGKYSFKLHEWTWSYNPDGTLAGHSEFLGTYWVSRKTLKGNGTWTLYDLAGNAIFTEPLTVTGTKLDP